MSRGARRWWISGLVLLALNLVLAAAMPDSCPQGLAIVLFVVWTLATLGWAGLWLWRKLTYRLSVRLLLSYLLVGVIPFLLLSILFGCAAYVFLGQYVSSELGTAVTALQHALSEHVERAVAEGAPGNAAAITDRLVEAPSLPPDLEAVMPRVGWVVQVGSEVVRSAPAPHPALPAWAEEGSTSGLFLNDGGPVLAAIERRGDLLTAVALPFDASTAELFNAGRWYEAHFLRPERDKHKGARHAVMRWHYSRAMPAAKLVRVGVWEDGRFVDVVLYGSGANRHLSRPFGLKPIEVCELVRVALAPGRHHPTSNVLAISLRMLHKQSPGLRLIVSYATFDCRRALQRTPNSLS